MVYPGKKAARNFRPLALCEELTTPNRETIRTLSRATLHGSAVTDLNFHRFDHEKTKITVESRRFENDENHRKLETHNTMKNLA